MDDIINQIDGQVQIIFEKTDSTINQTFRDALWMTQEEYDASSIDRINELKQERFANWLAIVTETYTTVTPE
jgi:hypothetical protein